MMFVMEVPWGDLWKQTCENMTHESLVDFAENHLPPEERQRIREHLNGCASCTAFCEDYKAFLKDGDN